jgi:hypothetical protein
MVRIEQTQSITDPLQVGYVDYFEMPVPVRLTLNDGSNLELRLNNTFNGQMYTVSLPVGKTITGVVFDPKKDIISKDNTTALSMIDFELSRAVNLYPNPGKDQITIQLPDVATLKRVNFINQLGQVVMSSSKNTIDVSNLSEGVYQITIETSEGLAHKKFIKN